MRLAAIRWMMGHMHGLASHAFVAQSTQMSASPGDPAQPPPGAARRKRVARTIMLTWAARLPWERRFQQRVILLAITLGAARGLARDGGTRVVAWDQRSRSRSLEAEAKRALRRGK
jgi:hypothetical protein